MKTPEGFKRGAATAAVYGLVTLLVGGALTAALALTTIPLSPAEARPSLAIAVGGGFLAGTLLHAPVAIICGLGLALMSPRIRRTRAWLGWAVIGAVLVTCVSTLILFRSNDATVLSWVIGLVAVSLPAALASVAAACATLKLRPSPTVKSTADVFV